VFIFFPQWCKSVVMILIDQQLNLCKHFKNDIETIRHKLICDDTWVSSLSLMVKEVKNIEIPSHQTKGTIKTQNPKDKTITWNKETQWQDNMNLYKNQRWNQVFRKGKHFLLRMRHHVMSTQPCNQILTKVMNGRENCSFICKTINLGHKTYRLVIFKIINLKYEIKSLQLVLFCI